MNFVIHIVQQALNSRARKTVLRNSTGALSCKKGPSDEVPFKNPVIALPLRIARLLDVNLQSWSSHLVQAAN